ncbi:hypothetical protein RF11_13256 [Thelohanellus kitauei]|uniref:DDE-1 domain-containing protein n=1 Tax=Thelohanellus kitauei TaxID=669202 RepID=A0A0C2J9K6_THEKT|nr:hypothetical protein RF11_13256 [Thelohanellus kitauei]
MLDLTLTSRKRSDEQQSSWSSSHQTNKGIIENLMFHYKKLLLCRRLEAMDEGKEFKFTLLDALHSALRAWEQVRKSTIRKFSPRQSSLKRRFKISHRMRSCSISVKLCLLRKTCRRKERELSDFFEANERIATGGSFTLEEIAEDMCSEELVEDEDVTVNEEVVSLDEAQRA